MRQFKPEATANDNADVDDNYGRHSAALHVPFGWEETPGTPKSHVHLKPEIRRMDVDDNYGRHSAALHVPFGWEETPGTPKSHVHLKPEIRRMDDDGNGGGKSEFDFGGLSNQRWMVSGGPRGETASAEELFEGSKMRPLKLPPRLEPVQVQVLCGSESLSTRWAKSHVTSPWFRSPRQWTMVDEFDPFEQAILNSRSKGDDSMKASDFKGDNIRKATPEERREVCDSSSSALLLPNKAVVGEVKFSSFRSMCEEYGPSRRHASTSLLGSSLRWSLSELLGRKTLPSRRRPLLHRLGFRDAIHHVFRKFFGSSR